MYIPSFKLISQSMLKKSPENADGRTDGRTDRRTEDKRTDRLTLPRHNRSRFSNGRIKRGALKDYANDYADSYLSQLRPPVTKSNHLPRAMTTQWYLQIVLSCLSVGKCFTFSAQKSCKAIRHIEDHQDGFSCQSLRPGPNLKHCVSYIKKQQLLTEEKFYTSLLP